MMQFKDGTDVVTRDGEKVGSVDRVVFDPRTKKLTHLVVHKGFLLPEDKLIPIDYVGNASEDRVVLRDDISGEMENFPDFELREYIPLGVEDAYATDFAAPMFWYPPYGAAWTHQPAHTVNVEQNIPEGAIALQEGANVIAEDDTHVGDVERILTDSATNRVTHLVISSGLLFKTRKLVPMNWVLHAKDNRVRLGVSADFMDRLPAFEG